MLFAVYAGTIEVAAFVHSLWMEYCYSVFF